MRLQKVVKRYEDECYIEFTDEEMQYLGWSIGDALKWEKRDDGSFILTKVNK